jgi:7-cyano-7-deazaguanine reductase
MSESILIAASPLGKHSSYEAVYNPDLLFTISREKKRNEIGVQDPAPFRGMDIWNAYEISWLDNWGKPHQAIGEITIDAHTENLVESKSLKLYLNSFNFTPFDSVNDVCRRIESDLAKILKGEVKVKLFSLDDPYMAKVAPLEGQCIDDLPVKITSYHPRPDFLETESEVVHETLVSHCLKSNCLVTHQPDWGSVQIYYQGKKIKPEGLLKYIVSFRDHNEFHEQCIERIFMDILCQCQPHRLAVYGRYTRRGGIDINPFRTNFNREVKNVRTSRQ